MNIVILVSGTGTNMDAIARAVAEQKIPAKLTAVISNNPNALALDKAAALGIETACVDHRDYPTREQFDRSLQQQIDRYQPDLVILAGFMRILTDGFVQHYQGKLINIHPSLLPKYRGLNTHKQVLENHETEHGCTVHFVTSELDSGAIIGQAKIPVTLNDSIETLSKKVQQQEHRLYPACVQLFCQGRIHMYGENVYYDEHKLPPQGLDLTDATL